MRAMIKYTKFRMLIALSIPSVLAIVFIVAARAQTLRWTGELSSNGPIYVDVKKSHPDANEYLRVQRDGRIICRLCVGRRKDSIIGFIPKALLALNDDLPDENAHAQSVQKPSDAAIVTPAVPTATVEQQTEFAAAQKRVNDAQIGVELARREADAASEHRMAVLNKIRADLATPEAKFTASLDKDGKLVFSPVPAPSPK